MPFQSEEFLTPEHLLSALPQSREDTQRDLAAEILHRFGEVRFVARGSSMIPSIYPGDLLTVRSQAIRDARCGELVLCFRECRFWVHRVMRKWPEGNRVVFATRGDALPQEDPSVDESELLGRVTSIVRYGKSVEFAQSAGPWTRLLRWGVRNSTALTKALLRWHSLRTRLLGSSTQTFESAPERVLECM
jgi:hypothetical protein